MNLENITLAQGDCLELMKDIADHSVDMVLCDLPYGMTYCKWDNIIPLDKLWDQYKRIVKPKGAIVLFGIQPFTSTLIASNPKWFRHEWIWQKNITTGFLNVKYHPLRGHENIVVFSKETVNYFPQMTLAEKRIPTMYKEGHWGENYDIVKSYTYIDKGERYPKSILDFPVVNRGAADKFHPTQKPVELCEYLIKTYTQEGETVLDNTMGSGTTGVACINTGRKFIGFELEEKYFDIAKERISKAQVQEIVSINQPAYQQLELI
jgi:DNA modification methylase